MEAKRKVIVVSCVVGFLGLLSAVTAFAAEFKRIKIFTQECGLIERALEELYMKEFKIVDQLSYKEQEVSLLEKLGSIDRGEWTNEK